MAVSTQGIHMNDVPRSQHSIFIRGFPGEMEMEKIRDFFADESGSCTIDFFKTSMDRQYLHVAVRFETREVAREMFNKFNEKKVLGYPVTMTWFRDVRRFASTVRGGGNGGGYGYNNRGRGRYMGGGGRGMPYNNRGGGRPPTVHGDPYWRPHEPRHNVTRTIYPKSESRRSRSRSRSRSLSSRPRRSRSSSRGRRSKSMSRSPRSPSSSPHRRSPRSPKTDEVRDILGGNKQKKKKKLKRKRLSSVSSKSSGELTPDYLADRKLGLSPKATPVKSSVAGSMLSDQLIDAFDDVSAPAVPKKRERIVITTTGVKVPLSPKDEPTESVPNGYNSPTVTDASGTTAAEKKSAGRFVTLTNEMINIQKKAVANVLERPDASNSPAGKQRKSNSSFKLSSVTKQLTSESERQKRIRNLPQEKAERLRQKKESNDQQYKDDCETFSTVVKMLASKDPSIEDKLLGCLQAALKDIGQKFIDELEEFTENLLAEAD